MKQAIVYRCPSRCAACRPPMADRLVWVWAASVHSARGIYKRQSASWRLCGALTVRRAVLFRAAGEAKMRSIGEDPVASPTQADHVPVNSPDRLDSWKQIAGYLGRSVPTGSASGNARANFRPFNFVSHVKVPVLMVNGKYDYFFPLETSQQPLFRLLGTPSQQAPHSFRVWPCATEHSAG